MGQRQFSRFQGGFTSRQMASLNMPQKNFEQYPELFARPTLKILSGLP